MFVLPALLNSSLDTYRIVEIDRVTAFAGKMGRAVRENWRVTRDGREYSVVISLYHTHVAGTPKPFQVGESVMIEGTPKNGVLKVRIRQVRR